MINEYYFIDKSDESETKVLASTFDFAYLIFCNQFGFYEVASITEYSLGKYYVDITPKD